MKKALVISIMMICLHASAEQKSNPALETALQLLSEANSRIVSLSAIVADLKKENDLLKQPNETLK